MGILPDRPSLPAAGAGDAALDCDRRSVQPVAGKKDKPIDLRNIEPEDRLKYEIAGELGLLDRVLEGGWKSLTAKETGRVGGILARRRREAARAGTQERDKA